MICDIITLTNALGASVTLSSYGARLVSCRVPDRQGQLANVVWGAPQGVAPDLYYAGATVGRVANRIRGARFTIDGHTYHLDRNDGANSNHGGSQPLSSQLWQASHTDSTVRFRLDSRDGEGGYPGNVCFEVEYEWTAQCELKITHRAVTDRSTMVNLTNHAYFNLSGELKPIDQHELQIMADEVLVADDEFLPTGERLQVAGSAFDFTTPQALGPALHSGDQRLKASRGFNHCYLTNATTLSPAARLYDPESGRQLDVETDLPGTLLL